MEEPNLKIFIYLFPNVTIMKSWYYTIHMHNVLVRINIIARQKESIVATSIGRNLRVFI